MTKAQWLNDHHADIVGSLLRSSALLEARSRFRAGQLFHEAYLEVENAAVDDALRLQESVGLDVLTDGEMRRDIFFGFFVSGMSGLSMIPGNKVRFHNHDTDVAMEVQIPFTVTDKLVAKACPGVEEFTYAQARTDRRVKVTLPSPMMVLGFWAEQSRDAYPNPFDLASDAADAVAGWMQQLAAAGCTYIQIDAPELNEAYCDASVRDDLASQGIDPREYIAVGTDLIERLGNLDLPGVTKCLHVCKGNGTQSWIAEGGYDAFSGAVFKRAAGFDIFHMEYDDDRSGGFEPLANLPDDKIAILGLLSTKWNRLESIEELTARVKDAARFHPLDKLGLATQCGFASAGETAADRRVMDDTQTAKLARVVEACRSIWG